MKKRRREYRIKWKNYVFTPRGGDPDIQQIRWGDYGFMELCWQLYHGSYLHEYEIRDSKFIPSHGGRNIATDWTGFDEKWQKHSATDTAPPSLFSALPLIPELCRRRMLHAVLREYSTPEALADDIAAWIGKSNAADFDQFVRSVERHRPSSERISGDPEALA